MSELWPVGLLFLFLLKNIDCGYSLEPPHRGGSNKYSLEPPHRGSSNEYPQSMFRTEIRKISDFLSEIFRFFFCGKIFSIFE